MTYNFVCLYLCICFCVFRKVIYFPYVQDVEVDQSFCHKFWNPLRTLFRQISDGKYIFLYSWCRAPSFKLDLPTALSHLILAKNNLRWTFVFTFFFVNLQLHLHWSSWSLFTHLGLNRQVGNCTHWALGSGSLRQQSVNVFFEISPTENEFRWPIWNIVTQRWVITKFQLYGKFYANCLKMRDFP